MTVFWIKKPHTAELREEPGTIPLSVGMENNKLGLCPLQMPTALLIDFPSLSLIIRELEKLT